MTPDEYLKRSDDAFEGKAKQASFLVSQPLPKSPDEYAQSLTMAKSLGLPPVLVDANYKSFAQRVAEKRNETILKSSPVLTDWIAKDDNFRIAADKIEELSWWELLPHQAAEMVKGVPGGVVSTSGMAMEGTGQLLTPRDPADRLPLAQSISGAAGKSPEEIAALRQEIFKQGVINPQYAQSILSDVLDGSMTPDQALEALEPALGPALEAASDWLQSAGQSTQEFGEGILPATPGMEESFGREVGSGLGSLLTILGVGLLTGGTGAAGFGAMMGAGEAAARARKAGQDEDTQTIAAVYGVFPGLTEVVPIERLLRNPITKAGFASLMRSIGKQVALEGGQEAVQELLQNAIAQNLYAPDQGLLEDVARSFQVGGFIGGLVEAGRIAFNAAMPGRFRARQAAAQQAEQAATVAADISQQAQSSGLRQRSPDKFREYLERATEGTDIENVYIPAEKFQEYFQDLGVDPYSLIDDLDGVTRDDFDVALAGGGDLRIPTATYAARMAGTEHDAFLIQNIRFSPDAQTQSEAAEFNERFQELQREAYEEAERQRKEDERYRSFEQEIYETMLSRARVAGRSLNEAENVAQLYVAEVRTAAADEGMTIDEYLAKYPLPEIQGSIPQGFQTRNVDALTRTLAEARKRREVGLDKRGPTLLEFIADYGGILDRGGELRARDAAVIKRGRGKKTLRIARDDPSAGTGSMFGGGSGVDEQGRAHGPDDVARAAIEAGYMRDHPVVSEYLAAMERGDQVPDITAALWDAIDEELRGNSQYSADAVVDQGAIENEAALDGIEEYLDRLGVSLDDSDDVIRAAIEKDQAEQRAADEEAAAMYFQNGGINTESEAFKRWFGDSKVVDDQGKPLVVYHGGVGGIEAFDPERIGSSFDVGDEAGFFFTTGRGEYPGSADDYAQRAQRNEGSGEVYSVYLKIENPYTLEQYASDIGSTVDDLMYYGEDLQSPIYVFDEGRSEIMQRVLDGGYDGIAFKHRDLPDEALYVALEPTQIKSVNNRGTFDPADARIYYQSADPVDSDAFKKWFGDSVIVDENDDPLVVYHGTDRSFDAFNMDADTSTGVSSPAAFFTESEAVAAGYGSNVEPVYLKVESPVEFDFDGKSRVWFDGADRSPSELVSRIAEIRDDLENGYFDSESDLRYELEEAGWDITMSDNIDGVIFRNVQDTMDLLGGEVTNHYAVFEPTQIKSVNNRGTWDASDARIYYQSGDQENLIVQHNLTADNLLFADKMRGLAVPSVAVSNVDYPLDNFGEITLLGGPDMVDPRKDRAAKVFDADIYSPRYPTVRYKINQKKMRDIWKRLDEASRDLGHVLSGELDDGEVERSGLSAFRDSSAVQLQFLRDTGRDIELPQEVARSNYLKFVPELSGMSVDSYAMNNDPAVKDAVNRAIDLQIEQIIDASPDLSADELRSSYYMRDGSVRHSVIRDINQEKQVARNPGVDRIAARQAVRDAVIPHTDEFHTWVDNNFGDVIAGEQIETQTASGNWRYLPHTLDNVVKVLKRKLRDGEGFNYGVGSIRSTVANQFKNVSAIKAARGRLIPADDMKALKDEVDNEFVALAGKFAEHAGSLGKGFGWLDIFSDRLKEVAERGVDVLNSYEDGVPTELAQEAVAFLDKLANMPTEYFEAKIQRAVGINEFKAAVLPKDAKKEVRDVLKDARVPVFEYDPNVDGSRAAAIRRAAGQERLLFQQGGTGNRGSLRIMPDGRQIISLFENANLSTLLHETGHVWLTNIQARAADGSEVASERMEQIKAWWRSNAKDVAKDAMRVAPDVKVSAEDVIAALDNGTTGDAAKDVAIDAGMQEQFARAAEVFLMEGKAPTAELQTAFDRFRSWLLAVYERFLRAVGGDGGRALGVNVSPEIKAVFDRILATEAELASARERSGDLGSVFASAEQMGLTDDEYARFLKLRERSESEAKARLYLETMRPERIKATKEYKAERAKVRDEVEREINSWRQYRAHEWMANRRWLGENQPENMPDMRMSKDILVERYGAGILSTLPRGLQTVYAVKGGSDPDDLAGWFGFDSGDEMVRAMEVAPPRKEAIEAETDKRMRELHGDPLNDGSIEAAALDAVHTDRRGEWLAAELKAVAEVSGIDVALTARDAREGARQSLNRMRVRDAIASQRFLAAERKAGEEAARLGRILAREKLWADAARRRIASKARQAVRGEGTVDAPARQIDQANRSIGNYNETVQKFVQAKRRQLVNHALYMESRKVADEVEKAENYVAKLGRKTTRDKIAGAGRRENAQVDYLGAIDDILEQYDFRRISGSAEERRASLSQFIEAMKASGRENELAIPDAVIENASRKPYKTLSVEELRGVIDSLKNLEHIALRWNALIDAQNERQLDAVTEEIVAAFDENMPKRPPGRVGSRGEAFRSGVQQTLNSVLNASTILREIDGFADFGAAYRNLKAPIDEAMNRLIVRKEKAANDLDALYSVYTKDERRRMAVREHIPALGYSLSKWERIAIALNTGNEGNYQRLTDERVRGALTEAQVSAVLSSLDARDADFVQSVWDYLETFRDDIAARERRVTGVEPKWVEARPVEVGGKMLKGGYYPLQYDPRLSELARDDDENQIWKEMRSGRFGKAQTRNGHLKERAQSSGRAIEFDMSVMHRHVNQVIYDLELSEAVSNSWRILQDNRVRSSFTDAGRSADFDALEAWLLDIGQGELKQGDIISRGARTLKSNFTAAKLAFNLSTVMVQVTGLPQSMVVVGKKNMALGIAQTVANPFSKSNEIAEKSAFMKSRQTTFNKDIYDMFNDPKIGPVASRWNEFRNSLAGKLGMWLMTKVQFYVVDVPTWLAGYNQGMKKFGNDEAKAIAHADAVVKRAQASGLFSDRSAVERGTLSKNTRQNDVVRLFTALGSYMFAKFNVAYERTMKANRTIRDEGIMSIRSLQEVLSWTLDMAFLFTVEAVLYAAIKGKLPDDDDDEDDGWLKFLAKETGLAVMSTIPFVRDVGSALSGFEGGGAYGAITKEVAAPLIQLEQGDLDKALVKSIINGTGLATGMPSSQINRAVDAGWRQMEGEDVSPLEYLLGRMGKQ